MAGVAEQRDSDRLALQPDSRGAAVWTALGGGIASIACGGAAIWLVRDQLHISCGVGQPGSEGDGTWMCADGISYLWVAVVLGAMLAFGVLAGALTAGLVRPARAACLILVLLAAAMAVWILGWTWHASSELVWAVPPDTLSVDYWYAAVLPAAIASAAAFLPALVGIFTRGAAARVLFAAAAAGLLVATALQPGLSVNTLAAAGLLAAAAVRAQSDNRLADDHGALGTER